MSRVFLFLVTVHPKVGENQIWCLTLSYVKHLVFHQPQSGVMQCGGFMDLPVGPADRHTSGESCGASVVMEVSGCKS